MPKYNESAVSGDIWRRAEQIIINNPYEGTPSIIFNEEDIIQFPNEIIHRKVVGQKVTKPFTMENASTEFNLINPQTDEIIEGQTSTFQTLYVLLYSLYFHLAIQRDRGPSPYGSWVWSVTTNEWVAPVEKPDQVNEYIWDEELLSWVLI